MHSRPLERVVGRATTKKENAAPLIENTIILIGLTFKTGDKFIEVFDCGIDN